MKRAFKMKEKAFSSFFKVFRKANEINFFGT